MEAFWTTQMSSQDWVQFSSDNMYIWETSPFEDTEGLLGVEPDTQPSVCPMCGEYS